MPLLFEFSGAGNKPIFVNLDHLCEAVPIGGGRYELHCANGARISVPEIDVERLLKRLRSLSSHPDGSYNGPTRLRTAGG